MTVLDSDSNGNWLRMAQVVDMGKSLLRDTIHTGLQPGRQGRELVDRLIAIVDLDPFLGCFSCEGSQGFGQCAILEGSCAQVDHRTASFFEVFACQVESAAKSLLGTLGMISYKRVGGLELQCDGGEALRESIVNLACQAGTFLDVSPPPPALGLSCGEPRTRDGST